MPMIDPLLSLAFAMHTNKGVYALLVGSGLSRPAGIPTGWEIVLDLIRKLAHLERQDCGADPAAWYTATYKTEPDYSTVLHAIARLPAERSQLLRSYFEPSADERALGLKIPTEAHHAIARLVASGHIRVIVTTNFDRLIETAIEQTGVVPSVIATADAAEGALPITHARCVVVKVHGDYLDMRIKNTEAELAHYDRRLDRLLDRVFDEFGLIVCGWSAEWDGALRAALERCRSRRFMTYWCTRASIGERAGALVTHRAAERIQIESGDLFFRALAERVAALAEYPGLHPLSVASAIATVKSYLAEDKHRIRLGDLFHEETERLYHVLEDKIVFPLQAPQPTAEALRERISRYEDVLRVLQAMIAAVCYWGESGHHHILSDCLRRIANPLEGLPGMIAWASLQRYPAMLIAYVGCIAAIQKKKYGVLKTLLTEVTVRGSERELPLAHAIYPGATMTQQFAQGLAGMDRHHVPVSDHLAGSIRESLRNYLPDDKDYEKAFDRLEYLWAMIYVDLASEKKGAPLGRFGYRRSIIEDIEREIKLEATEWGPLRAGLFGGSLARLTDVKKFLDGHIERATMMW